MAGKVVDIRTVRTRGRSARRVGTKDDPFLLEGDLNMDQVYPDTSDSHGHSDKLQVRIRQGFKGAMGEVLEHCPQFRNEHDFMRTAAHHLLHHMHLKLKDEVPTYIGREVYTYLRRDKTEAMLAYRKAIDLELETHHEALDYATSTKSVATAVEVLEDVTECMKDLEQGTSQLELAKALQTRARKLLRELRGPKKPKPKKA